MKKIILAITALLTTMIMIAQPLMVHAEDESPEITHYEELEYPDTEIPSYVKSRLNGYSNYTGYNFLYMVGKWKPNPDVYNEYKISYTSADVIFNGDSIRIDNATGGYPSSSNEYGKLSIKKIPKDNTWSNYAGETILDFDSIIVDFDAKSIVASKDDTIVYSIGPNDEKPMLGTYNIYSNIPEMGNIEPTLDLSISFAYPFSGTMTRHTTGANGLPTAADGNIMYVDNRRGDDAQFLMAIVPHGQTLSFNTWIYTGRDNIIGNPQYVYVCDEWQSFGSLSAINIADSTASANSIYAACAWHASPAGSTRSYNLMYESMDLKANTEYDVLVYACLNPDMEEMSGFYYDNNNLGGTYSVCGTLTDVQLVYSSTFSMTDPVKFNPDYKNVHDSSYAWNPNDTNAGLWENGSAYKDENGNVVIKGFKTGSSTLSWENSGSGSGYNTGGGTGANINVNKAYGGFFGWFKGLLGILPTEYNLLILFGLTGMIAIGIIKAVK